jgi:hypothetical protein
LGYCQTAEKAVLIRRLDIRNLLNRANEAPNAAAAVSLLIDGGFERKRARRGRR